MKAPSRLRQPITLGLFLIAVILTGGFVWSQYKAMQHAALLQSVTAGDHDAVRAALARGVDVNRRFGGDGDTALHRAAALERSDMAELLIQSGANPNIADEGNSTPLLVASYRGRTETVRLLIAAGANVNEPESRFGHTPLIDAAWKGHTGVVRLLLDAGADITARTVDGKTALDKARREQHGEIVNMLCAASGVLPGTGNC